MKRYLLFGCHTYYPSGGSGDVRANADTITDLIALEVARIENTAWAKCDDYEILDMQERRWLSDKEVDDAIRAGFAA